jgi:hypothetical protein
VQRLLIFLFFLALGGCGYTHRFEVRSDEAIQSGVVELKDKSARLEVRNEHFATGELAIGADADGRIIILHISGGTTVCPIGYVTRGEQEPHRITIEHGKCTWQSDG